MEGEEQPRYVRVLNVDREGNETEAEHVARLTTESMRVQLPWSPRESNGWGGFQIEARVRQLCREYFLKGVDWQVARQQDGTRKAVCDELALKLKTALREELDEAVDDALIRVVHGG